MKRVNDEDEKAVSGGITGKQLLDIPDNTGGSSVEDMLTRDYLAADEWQVGLERTQRLLLNIDDEPMVFDESSIARVLKNVASKHKGFSDEFILLHAVANALLGLDDHFKLKLTQLTRGKYKPPNVVHDQHERRMSILHSVADLEKSGWKKEAAIARMQERFGISRAAVFADIKKAKEFLKTSREMFGPENSENPRSNDFEN